MCLHATPGCALRELSPTFPTSMLHAYKCTKAKSVCMQTSCSSCCWQSYFWKKYQLHWLTLCWLCLCVSVALNPSYLWWGVLGCMFTGGLFVLAVFVCVAVYPSCVWWGEYWAVCGTADSHWSSRQWSLRHHHYCSLQWFGMYVCVCMYVCMYVCVYVCMYVCMYVHWNLRTKDTLGPTILSTIERSSSFLIRLFLLLLWDIMRTLWLWSVLCREVVPFSEGPLSEVPLDVCIIRSFCLLSAFSSLYLSLCMFLHICSHMLVAIW